MNYPKAIKIIRSIFNLEQRDLAGIVGVDPSFISQIESGKKNTPKKFPKLMAVKLDIPVSLITLLASNDNYKIDKVTKLKIAETLLENIANAKKW